MIDCACTLCVGTINLEGNMLWLIGVGLTAATLVSVLLKMSSQSVSANLDLLVTFVKPMLTNAME